MRVAVTGLSGQVSTALQALNGANLTVLALGRPSLDLTTPQSVLPALEAAAPDVIVNAAAFTQVDAAESQREAAFAANGAGAGAVAAAAATLGKPLIQLSTDYVFDGEKIGVYVEQDQPNPQSVYGASKLAGEQAVAAAHAQHIILRLAWVYGPHGQNFVRTMLRLAADRDSVRVVADQVGAPTSSLDIANAVVAIARAISAPDFVTWGVFHLGAGGSTNWADFAEAIFAESRVRRGPSARVEKITTAEFGAAAKRPRNSLLASDKAFATFGVRLPEWRDSLRTCLHRLILSTPLEQSHNDATIAPGGNV